MDYQRKYAIKETVIDIITGLLSAVLFSILALFVWLTFSVHDEFICDSPSVEMHQLSKSKMYL